MPRDVERCAQCNEVHVVPLSEFSIKPDRVDRIIQKIRKAEIIAWQQNMWPPESNRCSRCHQMFDDHGICPCGIDSNTGRPFGT